MAKQLYDYWFVQFDFPNADGKPYKSSGGKMVWNERLKREIPMDWSVVNVDEYLSATSERINLNIVGDMKYTPIEVLPRKQMSFSECAPIDKATSGLCKYNKQDILLSNRRVYFHKVCIAPFDGITRDTVIILRPYNPKLLGYSYQLVNANHFIDYATLHSYGSEQPVLSWSAVQTYKVLKPSDKLDFRFSDTMKPIIESVIENNNAISSLTKLRDELLPLLMNGQVSVNYDLTHD